MYEQNDYCGNLCRIHPIKRTSTKSGNDSSPPLLPSSIAPDPHSNDPDLLMTSPVKWQSQRRSITSHTRDSTTLVPLLPILWESIPGNQPLKPAIWDLQILSQKNLLLMLGLRSTANRIMWRAVYIFRLCSLANIALLLFLVFLAYLPQFLFIFLQTTCCT